MMCRKMILLICLCFSLTAWAEPMSKAYPYAFTAPEEVWEKGIQLYLQVEYRDNAMTMSELFQLTSAMLQIANARLWDRDVEALGETAREILGIINLINSRREALHE